MNAPVKIPAAAPHRAAHACTSHHHACACREHRVAVLVKAALDASCELDELKNDSAILSEDRAKLAQLVERIEVACEALGETEEKQPCQHVFVVADECAKCGALEEERHL